MSERENPLGIPQKCFITFIIKDKNLGTVGKLELKIFVLGQMRYM